MPITRERAAAAIIEVLAETVDKKEAKELGKLQSWLRRHPDTLEHVPEEDDNDAIVGFLLAEMAAAQPQPGGVEQFERLLSGNVNQSVVEYAVRFMPEQVAVANTAASAKAVYNMALQLPHTATRLKVLKNEHIAINGMLKANVLSRSTLLHAFSAIKLTPYLLKIPRKPADAKVELSAWEALAHIPHLAGPLILVGLEGEVEHTGRVTCGLLMPLYPATLQHVPVPMDAAGALKVGREVKDVLDNMHQAGWFHNDVKAPNIFLDNDGTAHLGDLGAARRAGGDADERTLSHLPYDLDQHHIDSTKSTAACDMLLLAVTLLERMGKLKLGDDALSMVAVHEAATEIGDAELVSFVKSLLPG
eukprot:CAMPEP_0202884914 /NCGR_PEP_ID=MMETSP1391-20130828/41393_1 /ASSEMBLY_ACC=CAM_ASM_000867 /TAXON_ID=1034604 /ORGANISM="Chlamydomonas leiostraca, Strain SAG 11-49" /LENGTH=360 /DNA_ID=CAMNT_0049568147 /DNA_START=60 /DNA_END=1142 /DNA_ORIENTATION=+